MKFTWTFIFLLLSVLLFSQQERLPLDYVPNEFVVQLKPETKTADFFKKMKVDFARQGISFAKENRISERLNLYFLKTKTETENVKALLETLEKFPEVMLAGQNFKVQPREKIPNDPNFSTQWNMELIQAPDVWEVTTGGVTALGDTIVIAMMESGDYTHEDLIGNRWVNHNEIPDDGIDNDDNGFVDDYFGWNVVDSTDNVGFDFLGHGIRVGGIMGASGDNDIGVSGVNWNVKIMWIQNNLTVVKIIEGYEYVYQNRKLYNETNGERGAFIVTTNASYGIKGDSPNYPDGLQLEDDPLFPLWCAVLDMVGEEGVLNVGATANESFSVTEKGDMPSICPTDHLISVGEVNQQEIYSSAYGKPYVDLSAPGSNSPTTGSNNSYQGLDGTSAAAPHVAGGIALLYSVPCEQFALAARQEPAATALTMKEFILNGVDKFPAQEDLNVSGGRLNLKNSMVLIQELCGGQGVGILNIDKISPNPTSDFLKVEFTPNDFGDYEIEIFNSIGQLMRAEKYTAKEFLPNSFILNGMAEYKTGMYFLRISNQLDFTTSRFIVR